MAKNKKVKKSRRSTSMSGPDPVVEIQESLSSPKRRMGMSKAMLLAADYEQQKNAKVAQLIYTQVMEQCPTDREPALRLFNSYRSSSHVTAARLQAYRMLAMFRSDATIVAAVASFYNLRGETEKALELLEQGLEDCPQENRDILFRLFGYIYDHCGNRELAKEFYDKALSVNKYDVVSLYGLTKIVSKESREELLEMLLAAERSGTVDKNGQPYLHFALAYLYEKHDNDKYFHHLNIANKSVAVDSAQILAHLSVYYSEALKKLSAESVAAYFKPVAAATEPAPIFIAAPPRSGTTLLEQILGAHPATRPVGESSAFTAAITRVTRDLNSTALFWEWDDATQRIVLPKLNHYFYSHELIKPNTGFAVVDKSIENVQQVGLLLLTWPQARVIRLKRHPLDVILSCYHQFFATGHDHLFDLEVLAQYYVYVQKLMDLWQGLFPDNIMTLEYEELVSDQERQTRRLLEFCQLPWDDACLNFQEHIGTVHTVSNHQVRQPLYKKSVAKWKPFYKQLQPAIKVLERELGLLFEV